MNNLLSYGIAFNFFSNYSTVGAAVNNTLGNINNHLNDLGKHKDGIKNFGDSFGKALHGIDAYTNKVTHSIFNLKNALIGLVGATGLGMLGHHLFDTALELEKVYTKLITVFGSQQRVKEHFRFARNMEMQNPFFNLEDLHTMVAQLAMSGLAKTEDDAKKNIMQIGDFAAARGIDLKWASDMVIKASQGNWQSLSDNTGLRQATLMETATHMFDRQFTDFDGKTKSLKAEAIKAAAAVNSATRGTKAYSEALIRFVGLYEKGGIERASQTIAANLKGFHNMLQAVMMDVVGLSQEDGTFANAMGKTFKNMLDIVRGKTHELGVIAEGTGYILKTMWGSVDSILVKGAEKFASLIDRAAAFFNDFKGRLAPFIVYMTLMKFKVIRFFDGFKEGFAQGIAPLKPFFSFLIDAFKFLFGGKSEDGARKLGKTLGTLIGLFTTIKVLSFTLSKLWVVPSTFISTIKTLQSVTGKGGVAPAVGTPTTAAPVGFGRGLANTAAGAGAGILGYFGGSKLAEMLGGNEAAQMLTGTAGSILGASLGPIIVTGLSSFFTTTLPAILTSSTMITALSAAGALAMPLILAGLVTGVMAYAFTSNANVTRPDELVAKTDALGSPTLGMADIARIEKATGKKVDLTPKKEAVPVLDSVMADYEKAFGKSKINIENVNVGQGGPTLDEVIRKAELEKSRRGM